MIDKIAKIGRIPLTFLITLLSIVVSVLISYIGMKMAGQGLNLVQLSISILAPLVIASTVSWCIVGLLIRISCLEQEQRKIASYDHLTGVMTRRAFLKSCEDLLLRCREDNISFVLAFIDLDDFKKINDKHGHAAGDDVLISFGKKLQDCLRQGDISGRLGGEEFVVAFVGVDMENGIHELEKIRLSAEQEEVFYLKDVIRYTVSIGLALFDPNGPVELTELLSRADKAVYKAKANGKNRIEKDSDIS